MFKELFTEGKTHPNIKAMLPVFKNKGYKAKVSYGDLDIPFPKGVTEEEAIEAFLSIAPGEWEKGKREGFYHQGDLTVSFGEFSGKIFAGVTT